MSAKKSTKSPELIERAKIIREEIRQIFTDAASWNENYRTPEERPIDPDPDGEMRRALEYVNKYLDGVTLFKAPDIQKVIDDLDEARSDPFMFRA